MEQQDSAKQVKRDQRAGQSETGSVKNFEANSARPADVAKPAPKTSGHTQQNSDDADLPTAFPAAAPVDAASIDPANIDLGGIELSEIEGVPDDLAADFGELPEFETVELAAIEFEPIDTGAATADLDQIPAAPLVLAKPVLSPQAAVATREVQNDTDIETIRESAARRRFFLSAVPSWLISLLVHLGLILILAAITLDPVQRVISILQASSGDVEVAVEQFDLQGPTPDSSSDASVEQSLASAAPAMTSVVNVPEVNSPLTPNWASTIEAVESNQMTESILPSAMLSGAMMSQMSAALNSRSAASKSEMLERFGGSAASEKAVALALKWLADHQANDGGWSFNHSAACNNRCRDAGSLHFARNGATALALLPFLGAGQTHVEGQYKETVYRGLAYLINHLKVEASRDLPTGSWHEPGGRMYSHGLAAITICEAYAMTSDPDLLQPAQLSLNYLISAQNKRDGGWRYEPGERGDTSVVGWCVMALKSGKMGRLAVPDTAFKGADKFLDYVSTNKGAYFGYDKPTSKIDGRIPTTAVGLLCRMYLGYEKEDKGIQMGIKLLSETGPRMNDLYYCYYATQVMRHNGGPVWEKWNRQMRDPLIAAQIKQGHAAGSWYGGGPWVKDGGRLYTTALSTMILEVYYRHMPLYSERFTDDDFEI